MVALKTGRSYLPRLGVQEPADLYRREMSEEEFSPLFLFFFPFSPRLLSQWLHFARPVDNKCAAHVNSRMAADRK